MNSTADRSNGRILKNYIYANISLHKLAKILIEDWQIADRQRFPSVYKLFSLNCPRYGAQINAFIDMLGDLDLLPPSQWNPKAIHAGGKSLADAICRVQPRYVFCGHLHTCKDKYLKLDNTEIYNVSILDNNYKKIYEPLYLNI